MSTANSPRQFVTVPDYEGNTSQVPVSQLAWRPSAYAIVLREAAVLVNAQFAADGRKLGYDLPGGAIELGETSEVAVIREVREETGLAVGNPRLIDVANSYFRVADNEYDAVQALMLYYHCDILDDTISDHRTDPWEQTHMGKPEWLPLAALDTITAASSTDWRAYARRAAGM